MKMKTEYCSSNISYTTWIAPLTVYEVSDNTVYILVKLKASLEHIEEKYLLPFRVCIAEVTGHEYEVSFVTEDQVCNTGEKRYRCEKEKKQRAFTAPANLNPKYTF
jgi:chromosomal replication initiator protein